MKYSYFSRNQLRNRLKLLKWIRCIDKHEAAWFERDFSVCCASNIATLFTIKWFWNSCKWRTHQKIHISFNTWTSRIPVSQVTARKGPWGTANRVIYLLRPQYTVWVGLMLTLSTSKFSSIIKMTIIHQSESACACF